MQTLVGVYPSSAEADQVTGRLLDQGITRERIAVSSAGGEEPLDTQENAGTESRSWWSWLFGSDVPEEHRNWYRSNLVEGRTAVSVQVEDAEQAAVEAILHEHGAVDTGLTASGSTLGMVTDDVDASANAEAASRPRSGGQDEERIPVVKEELEVGKRETERRYHVHVYTTQRPVEESVTLRDERVVVERRPIQSGAAGQMPGEREFEVVEKHEEPVVSKTARATEEVVLRKDQAERTETVKDNVQETHVDVDKPGAADGPRKRSR